MQTSWRFAPLALCDDLVGFSEQLSQLKLLADEICTQQKQPWSWRLKQYEQLDQRFDKLESAVTLKLIESGHAPVFARLQETLQLLAEVLAEKTSGLIEEALAVLTDAAKPAWLIALLEDHDASVAAIHSADFANRVTLEALTKQLGSAERLADGSIKVLTQRLNTFKHSSETARQLIDGMCFADAQDYFDRLIIQANAVGTVSLAQLREIERASWCELTFSFAEAIDIVQEAFAELDKQYGAKVRRAYAEGRIRVLREGEPSMCMDTPAGSYIQLSYVNDMESLVLLAHECGHLVHQEIVRERYTLRQNIAPFLAESIALFFEHHVACYWFEKHDLSELLARWQKSREVEWCYRHRLLALFEYQLYGLKEINQTTVSALWVSLNHSFYPKQVQLDPRFLSDWQELAHIINSPFYYLIYPDAFSSVTKEDVAYLIGRLR